MINSKSLTVEQLLWILKSPKDTDEVNTAIEAVRQILRRMDRLESIALGKWGQPQSGRRCTHVAR